MEGPQKSRINSPPHRRRLFARRAASGGVPPRRPAIIVQRPFEKSGHFPQESESFVRILCGHLRNDGREESLSLIGHRGDKLSASGGQYDAFFAPGARVFQHLDETERRLRHRPQRLGHARAANLEPFGEQALNLLAAQRAAVAALAANQSEDGGLLAAEDVHPQRGFQGHPQGVVNGIEEVEELGGLFISANFDFFHFHIIRYFRSEIITLDNRRAFDVENTFQKEIISRIQD